MNDTYLSHHGVKGQKWGVRRYQNKDGSLTPLGKKRAAKLESQYEKVTGKKIGEKSSSETEQPKKKSVSEMSDSELQQYVTRLNNEKMALEYKKRISELTAKEKTLGEKFVDTSKDVLSTSITAAAKDATTKYLTKEFRKMLGVSDSEAKAAKKVGGEIKKEFKKAVDDVKKETSKSNEKEPEVVSPGGASDKKHTGKKGPTIIDADFEEVKTSEETETGRRYLALLEERRSGR